MPQMSPMNWLFLFIYFNAAFYISMVKLFFLSPLSINMKENSSLKVDNKFSLKI